MKHLPKKRFAQWFTKALRTALMRVRDEPREELPSMTHFQNKEECMLLLETLKHPHNVGMFQAGKHGTFSTKALKFLQVHGPVLRRLIASIFAAKAKHLHSHMPSPCLVPVNASCHVAFANLLRPPAERIHEA
jgi:hypothetical protein